MKEEVWLTILEDDDKEFEYIPLPKIDDWDIIDDLEEAADDIFDADSLAWRDAEELANDINELNEQIAWAKAWTIIDNIPFLNKVMKTSKFKQRSFEWKMEMVFQWYNDKVNELKVSYLAMEKYRDGLKSQYDMYKNSIEGVDFETLSPDDKFEFTQRVKTIKSLATSINRLEVRIANTKKTYKGMKISKTRYWTEMKNSIFEIGAAKKLDDALDTWNMVEEKATKTTWMLTEWVINSHKNTVAIWTKVISSDKLDANARKLLETVSDTKMKLLK